MINKMNNIYKKYNIDINHLSRDYIKHPLIKNDGYHLSEHPKKEDFIYLFLGCNVRRFDLAKYFNVDVHSIDNFVKEFGCKKSKKQSYLNSSDTVKENYGVSNIFQVEKIKEKQKNTIKTKYYVDNVSQLEEVKLKKISTTKINNTFSSSKDEEKINKLLQATFGIVKRQYSSDKYPFPCDFYIPFLDLYIEYQGTWTHGPKEFNCHAPYDKNNKTHRKVLEIWNSKKEKHKKYADAIKTWTIKDPLKRETAQKNNLNWIEFFTMDDFMLWYNKNGNE